jgi:hypothetical protein
MPKTVLALTALLAVTAPVAAVLSATVAHAATGCVGRAEYRAIHQL